MTAVGASAKGQQIRAQALAELDLRPGQTVIDVGCGPGVNLPDLAAGVAASGQVLGIDHSPVMLAAAQQRIAGLARVRLLRADAHALPLADASIDRARCDRVLQHVLDPALAIRELWRAARPGAVVTLTEPDWSTLAIDAPDLTASAAFTNYTCTRAVRNACLGRQLARLAGAAGFTVQSVEPVTILFRNFPEADRVLGLTRNSVAAVNAGYLPAETASQWLAALEQGPFLAAGTTFIVVAAKPA